jgi:hypothetical protein
LQRKIDIAVDEDPEAVEYARVHADILKIEELRARPTPRSQPDLDDLLPMGGFEGVPSAAELADAGMGIDEGVAALDGDEEVEPSMDDLMAAAAELMDGESILDDMSDDE